MILGFLFHNLFARPEDIDCGAVLPQQRMLESEFEEFLAYFASRGYAFVSSGQLLDSPLPELGVYITFDDGYASNARILPLLEKFDARATLFVSTSHVRQAKPFWWDVVFSLEKTRGTDDETIYALLGRMKGKTPGEIDRELAASYGDAALQITHELQRPFTPDELASWAASPRIELGNHTQDHAILTNLGPDAVFAQISGCQTDMEASYPHVVPVVSYPNGNVSDEVVAACHRAGLTFGLTVDPEPYMAGDAACDPMRMGRYVIWGGRPVAAQCEAVEQDAEGRA